MGRTPQWFLVIRASRYLKVPPWDLIDRPIVWMQMALEADSAEAEAKAQAQNRAAKRRR